MVCGGAVVESSETWGNVLQADKGDSEAQFPTREWKADPQRP